MERLELTRPEAIWASLEQEVGWDGCSVGPSSLRRAPRSQCLGSVPYSPDNSWLFKGQMLPKVTKHGSSGAFNLEYRSRTWRLLELSHLNSLPLENTSPNSCHWGPSELPWCLESCLFGPSFNSVNYRASQCPYEWFYH